MLEILLLVFLGKRLGTMLRAKGRSAGWFQLLLVLCWFGGELVGMIAMLVLFGGGAGGGIDGATYLGALLGAAGGAVMVFVIANHLAPLTPESNARFSAFPVMPAGQAQGPREVPPI